MDYRQNMVVPSSQTHTHEDDDDEDLEALRLAALKSVKSKLSAPIINAHTTQPHPGFPPYMNHKQHRDFYYSNRISRQNGQNIYYPSRNNHNLIEIVPMDSNSASRQDATKKTINSDSEPPATSPTEPSKFNRYHDNASGSDEEDTKEVVDTKSENPEPEEIIPETDNQSPLTNNSPSPNIRATAELEEVDEEDDESCEDENEVKDDDDDDILIMADHEEEDSLERLMDEMEREMTVETKQSEKKEKKTSKREIKELKKLRETSKTHGNKVRDRVSDKNENASVSCKIIRRSESPYVVSRAITRQRSPSPKMKGRKKSPRKSPPRRLSPRPLKKCQRDPTRLRSPRKSPPKYSPKLSPRRSPIRRSPLRKLSPRGRSPHSRSPIRRRSRSRSPRIIRVRSPRLPRSKSPRSPPFRISPRVSPHRLSPRRASPRSRSPKLSPRRPISPSARARTPKLSPRRSPWSSPRQSPRLSPRRRRSPPKEVTRKRRSLTPDNTSAELPKSKTKSFELSNNPVLEARRRKFESTRPIDPITDNKKIKLTKKETGKNAEISEESFGEESPKIKDNETLEDYEIEDGELNLHENYDFAEPIEDEDTVASVDAPPTKPEKLEKPKKKKKKDKEIYQVGKLKGELPLSERICKEKKCKKRHRDVTPDSVEEEEVEDVVEEVVDDEADLRTELSRRRAERLNRTVPIQSARLVQSAFESVANQAAKNKAKIQRHLPKTEDKSNHKEVRRVTVLHRGVSELHDSEDETVDSKVPIRFRLGLNKTQEQRETKSKRQSRKVKHQNLLLVNDVDRKK